MFVRTAHWDCKPECWGEAEIIFRTVALPILTRQPGFLLAQLTGERASTKRIAVTYWESESAHRQFAASPALVDVTAPFAHMFVDNVQPQAFAYPILREFTPLLDDATETGSR